MALPKNELYYGNNLKMLREYIGDESVDLVYLDPPFKSDADYNAFFEEKDGSKSASQIKAFEDTWTWDEAALEAYTEVVEGGGKVSDAMQAFRTLLGTTDMLAYLSMMAPRLLELQRVMKPTASVYLHCDSTASAHLRLLMDAIFGPENFRDEIIWRRTNARSTEGRWPRVHDALLFYTKSADFYFKPLKVQADKAKMPHTLITKDGKKYQTYELTAPGMTQEGESGKPWRGFEPSKWGRHWANNFAVMDAWDADGLIHWPKDNGFPRRRDENVFNAEDRFITVGDVWTDIDRINQSAKERLGYPTQKPVALLERIVEASSQKGDVVLDPFCGCGTSIAAAQLMDRRWIGIDITQLAIALIKNRLLTAYGPSIKDTFVIKGEPDSLEDAKVLAAEDPYQFQLWALSLVNARPSAPIKKGMDKGIDGRLFFHDEREGGKTNQVIISIKGGHLKPEYIRELPGIVAREKATIGVLISMGKPTKHMYTEALNAGYYENPWWGKFPKIQLLTIEELLAGKSIHYPHVGASDRTFKAAPKVKKKDAEQHDLL